MKIIAFHLPQFYTFPENDEWWGTGFTEWTNTKKAVPQFKSHYQPRIPLNQNYYCLTNPEDIRWQCNIAKQYGIYGFCFYHYWFKDGKQLLEKPVELFKKSEIDFHFCLSWANEPWTRSWDGKTQSVIMSQEYGKKDEWIKHFEYLLPFFKDERYIKIQNKPVFIIYRPEIFPEIYDMIKLWNDLAKTNGIDGIIWAVQGCKWNSNLSNDKDYIDYRIMFEPGYTGDIRPIDAGLSVTTSTLIHKIIRKLNPRNNVLKLSYKAYCKSIIKRSVPSEKYIPGFFTDWDNTPRRGGNANVFFGSNPKVFKQYFEKIVYKAKNEYKKDYIFINAWNEWAEGAYLEPDEKNGYKYLEAIQEVLQKTDEWPY